MTGPGRIDRTTPRAMRLRGLAPRAAFYLMLGVVSLAGVRAIVSPTPAPSEVTPSPVEWDLPAAGFAESFARAYLTWDPRDQEAQRRRVAEYMADPEAGAPVPAAGRGRQRVRWSAALATERVPGRRRLVTVAAETSRGQLVHLAVVVGRDGRGFHYVAGEPAIVGPPAVSPDAGAAGEDEVEDEQLRSVAERAVANYLAREKQNLSADLDGGAVVSLPSQPLRLRSVGGVTWAAVGRRVAVALEAEDAAGTLWTLRYELGVRKRERWYVRSIGSNPTSKEVSG